MALIRLSLSVLWGICRSQFEDHLQKRLPFFSRCLVWLIACLVLLPSASDLSFDLVSSQGDPEPVPAVVPRAEIEEGFAGCLNSFWHQHQSCQDLPFQVKRDCAVPGALGSGQRQFRWAGSGRLTDLLSLIFVLAFRQWSGRVTSQPEAASPTVFPRC